MHTLKPIDAAEIRAAAAETGAVLTVEEHNVIGGLGSAVAEILVDGPRVPFRRHGVPDKFVEVGPPAALYAHYRLDAAGIARSEEHTSELQSLMRISYAVFCLTKKKQHDSRS